MKRATAERDQTVADKEQKLAKRLLRHLWHEVYLDSYDDGVVTIECETCSCIIMSFKGNPSRKGRRRALKKLIDYPSPIKRGQLWVDSLEAVAELDLDMESDELTPDTISEPHKPCDCDDDLQIKNFMDVPE